MYITHFLDNLHQVQLYAQSEQIGMQNNLSLWDQESQKGLTELVNGGRSDGVDPYF
jgi:hypothetical protein